MSKYQFSKLEKKCEVEVKMGEMTWRPKLASFWESVSQRHLTNFTKKWFEKLLRSSAAFS